MRRPLFPKTEQIALLLSLAVGALTPTALAESSTEDATPVKKIDADSSAADPDATRQYTYSWAFKAETALAPRGGNTQGPELTLSRTASDAWTALRAEGISKQERDRRAILAMAGPYRASFDFIETTGYAPGYEPARPYQSWGTEKVYVLKDEPDHVVLQHVLVMRIRQEDGSLTEPMVVKHWRQDWRYQDRSMHEFQGDRRWAERRLSRREARGTWTQAVFQVDDSPRYEAVGRWEHEAGVSSWLSSETWRPLPRREFSVRDDYQVLVGTNRHTITPTGWVHEEHNHKVVLDEAGKPIATLAKEAGLNRYERIEGYDFAAGDRYLERTEPYWHAVRTAWADIYRTKRQFRLAEQVNEQPLFAAMFKEAEALGPSELDQPELLEKAQQTLAPFLSARR